MPNHLMDQLMPSLRDTELRVLLVLIRYTIGWKAPREHAFLTYGFLCRRTGRQSEAIARAIRNLERLGLIRRTLELSTERLHGRNSLIGIHPALSEDNKQINNLIKKQRRGRRLSTRS